MAPLFVFNPTENIVKYDSTPSTPIVIHSTNVAVVFVVPLKLTNKGLEVFVNFLIDHPLCALSAGNGSFFQSYSIDVMLDPSTLH
ncbi:hypothetical protein L2E82_22737 [Cichorium intybus]|uniref:Uncharacterized protein n=1 Tax=Cichorium intybus TaxID=13427 RepID=A0ACB9DZK9_CICIN|nr:hypothetical protein L2E82_22737 [Cichorium intybus]